MSTTIDEQELQARQYALIMGVSIDKARRTLSNPPSLEEIEEESIRLMEQANTRRAKVLNQISSTTLSRFVGKLRSLGR